MFLKRDYTKSEQDDFSLNVQPLLDNTNEAIPVYSPLVFTKYDKIIGWEIQQRYGKI